MNKYRAIEISYLTWNEMLQAKTENKYSSISRLVTRNEITEYEHKQLCANHYCACCVYCAQGNTTTRNCSICPGNSLWLKSDSTFAGNRACEFAEFSPYKLFCKAAVLKAALSKETSIYVKEIRDYFKNLLKEEQK